jgi:hypothetical protein
VKSKMRQLPKDAGRTEGFLGGVEVQHRADVALRRIGTNGAA